MINVDKPTIKVKFLELQKKYGVYDSHRIHLMEESKCPVCNDGLLLMKRDFTSFNLLSDDRCISCGQSFIYTDIPNDTIHYASEFFIKKYWRQQKLKRITHELTRTL